MANIQKLIEREKKERDLAEKHKKEADRLKKEIEYLRNQEIQKSVNKMNLNAEEYSRFIHALNDKESLLEAIEIIAGEAGIQTAVFSTEKVKAEPAQESIEEPVNEEERFEQ